MSLPLSFSLKKRQRRQGRLPLSCDGVVVSGGDDRPVNGSGAGIRLSHSHTRPHSCNSMPHTWRENCYWEASWERRRLGRREKGSGAVILISNTSFGQDPHPSLHPCVPRRAGEGGYQSAHGHSTMEPLLSF